MSDIDAILDSIPPTERARTLVDHHASIADQFVAEFEAGVIDQGLART